MEAKRSDRVIIHELLAFVQQKLDVMDELSLEQICGSSYSEDEIVAAKKVLADTAVTTIRLITRQRDGRGKKDLQDIFRMFKETDPDDVPTFVAQQLHKLPPVTFDHVDVTRLLKDITEIRSRLAKSEQAVVDLKMELAELRNKNAAPTISPQSAQNVTLRRRGNKILDNKPASSQRDTVCSRVVDRLSGPTTKNESSEEIAKLPSITAPAPAPPKLPVRRRRTTYAEVAQVKKAPVRQQADDEGFTLVEKRRLQRRPARNHRGTAACTTLRAAEPTTAIYISRFEKNTSGNDVVKYIVERCRSHEIVEAGVQLERLEPKRMTNFKSFVLRCFAKHKDVFLNPGFWPQGIVFRQFREPRPSSERP